MPGKGCKKHTPIVSKKQRGAMGAAYRKKKTGRGKLKGPANKIAKSMSEAELKRHLEESEGKKLPKRAKKKRKKKT